MNKEKIKMKSLDGKDILEIRNEILQLKKHLFNLRIKKSYGDFKNFHLFKVAKKNIARLNTKINQLKNKNA